MFLVPCETGNLILAGARAEGRTVKKAQAAAAEGEQPAWPGGAEAAVCPVRVHGWSPRQFAGVMVFLHKPTTSCFNCDVKHF